jgi:drug/metabolite transporter (DMT)-like permease
MLPKNAVEKIAQPGIVTRMKLPFSQPVTAILLALAAFLIFSVGDSLIKWLSRHYDTFTIAFYIGALVVLLVLALSPFAGGMRPVLTLPDRRWHILRGLCLAVQFYLMIYAFSVMSLTKAYALLFAAPLLTVALAWPLLGERTSPAQALLVLAGFAGVLVILRPGMIPVDAASAGMLAAALAFALSNIIIRKMRGDSQPFLAWPFYSEGIIMLGALPFFLRDPVLPAAPHMLMFLAIAALSVVALALLGTAFRLARAGTVAPFHYVQILWAAGLGYALFGDTVDAWTAAGTAMIVASGLLMIRRAAPAPAALP